MELSALQVTAEQAEDSHVPARALADPTSVPAQAEFSVLACSLSTC